MPTPRLLGETYRLFVGTRFDRELELAESLAEATEILTTALVAGLDANPKLAEHAGERAFEARAALGDGVANVR